MTGRPTLSILALALAIAACTGPARQTLTTPSHGSTPPAAKPESNMPGRINRQGKISSISLDDFYALQQSGQALVYDARAPFFYHLGHIPGAVNLPKNHGDNAIAARESEIKTALAAGKTIIVYCSSMTCPDARTLAIHISGFGYPASIFAGGWEAWRQADLPGE